MKKLFAGLVASIMMAGLVSGLTASTASAAPYPASVPVTVKVDTPDGVKQGDPARIGVKVTKNGDVNGSPHGTVVITVTRNAGGYTYRDSKDYSGDKIWFKTSDLNKRGGYTVRAHFEADSGSKWMNDNGYGSFSVTRNG